MQRLQVEIDDPSQDKPSQPIGFDDPMEAHRFADEQARQLPTTVTVMVYDTEAHDYCGRYCGRAEPQDHANELPTLARFGADYAQVQAV